MAYPFNSYGGYQPNSYAQPTIPPVTNNQYQTYNNQPTMGNFGARNFIFATEEEMKAYILPPNNQIFGLDRPNAVLRIKTADNMGNVNIEAYKLSLIDESKPKTTDVKESEYLTKKDIENLVTKDEFNSFMGQVKDIEKLLKVGGKNERPEKND